MERLKRLLGNEQHYEPVDDDSQTAADGQAPSKKEKPLSVVVYMVFMLLGIAMLWAWNMYMAAAPYFQRRFASSQSILDNFQAAELSVAQVANLGSVLVLAKLQASASYPKRIAYSLLINSACFLLLAMSTRTAVSISAAAYLAFVLVAVFVSSIATGLMQNGTFSFVAAYSRPAYMQAVMLGQAVAGVLPPLVQMLSVLSSSKSDDGDSGSQTGTSAFAYFMAAVGVTALALVSFVYLLARHRPPPVLAASPTDNAGAYDDDNDDGETANEATHARNANPAQRKKSVSLLYLARRLLYPWTAVFLTFGITMVFPVFTQQIRSTAPDPQPPALRPAAFIPLGLLVWNIGDLLGRAVPLAPALSLARKPKALLALAALRALWIPLYLACNVQRTGAQAAEEEEAESRRAQAMGDAFYLLVVQLPFGFSNGYVGSCCMMGAGDFVGEGEREAAGGFMGLMLVAGLTVGSFASFFVGNV